MKNLTFLVLAIMAIGLAGCSGTAEGMKEDTQKNTEKAGEAGRDIGAAVSLTPPIEMAIRADPNLNDAGNSINVDSSEERVTLKGHVKTAELKSAAEAIAVKVIQEKGGKQAVYNELEIKP